MKRCSLILIGLILLMSLAAPSFANYPKPDGQFTFTMQQGWYNGTLAWFICTDSNNIWFAQTKGLTFAPKLSSAIGSGAAAMFIVRNPAATQGPILTAVPGGPTYSGVWQVVWVDWVAGATKVPIISHAQVIALVLSGDVVATRTNIALDCPVMAVGPLGGPWYPAPVGSYRIAQGKVFGNYTYTKRISLPTYSVFCQNPITKKITTGKVIVTDAETQALADAVKGNYAPALALIPYSDTMRLWSILDSPQFCQLPVEEACPTSFSWRNQNYVYSPIQRLSLLNRVSVAPSAVINNDPYVDTLLLGGALSINDDTYRFNAPMVPSAYL